MAIDDSNLIKLIEANLTSSKLTEDRIALSRTEKLRVLGIIYLKCLCEDPINSTGFDNTVINTIEKLSQELSSTKGTKASSIPGMAPIDVPEDTDDLSHLYVSAFPTEVKEYKILITNGNGMSVITLQQKDVTPVTKSLQASGIQCFPLFKKE